MTSHHITSHHMYQVDITSHHMYQVDITSHHMYQIDKIAADWDYTVVLFKVSYSIQHTAN